MFIRITKKTMGYLFLIVSLILPPIPVQWVYADETVGFFEDIIGVTDPDVLLFEDELADEGEAGRNETDLDESITEVDSNDNDDKLKFFEEELLEEEVFEERVDSDAMEMAEDILEESGDLEEGVWGTVRWTYNEANKTMILYGGVAGAFGSLPWRAYRRTIEHIIVAERVQLPPDSAQLFEACVSLQSIQNEHNFDTSLVTNMRGLFLDTPSLKSLDLSTWDTRSVEFMTNFIARSGIESLDISGFDMRAVTNMRGMFSQSVHLKELTLGEQSLLHSIGNLGNTADIPQISVSGRYTGRWVLRESLDWATGRIAYEDSLTLATEYDGRYPGTYIWEEHLWGTVPWAYDEDTQTITLYDGTAGLAGAAPWKTHNNVKRIRVEGQVILPVDSRRLFSELDELIEIESGHRLDVSQVRDFRNMFSDNTNLEHVDVSNWDVSEALSLSGMFSGCKSLKSIEVGEWKTHNVTDISHVFNDCAELTEIDVGKWDTSNVVRMVSVFRGCLNLRVIDVSKWETGKVTNMSYMFEECRELIELDVSNWDTREVVNMESLFQYCVKLSVIDVSKWDVSKVENMAWLFNQCQSVEVLDVSKWDTKSAKIMNTMFNNCMQVEILDVSNWQTANVTNMRIMFTKLEKVKTLDVSNWDTSSVTNIQGMFLNCFQLTKVDISNWNLDAVPAENIDFLFENCYQLKEIVLGANTRLSTIVLLPEVADTDNYTGAWRLRNSDVYQDTIKFESSEAFMRDFDGSHPGTYVWERTIPASFTASFDPVSDQVSVITGVAFEEADALRISYQNLDGTTYEIDSNSAQFEWLTYQDEQAGLRKFQIKLAENERVATDSTVTLWMARPSHDHESIEVQKEVVKGVRYQASDFTLSAERLAQVTTLSELHTLIIEDSGARAVDVLSQQDMTEEFRVVETDLSLDISEDGSYYAVLEIGHKAYQITIGIDVTSKLEHMRVTIPTKMIFESLVNETESNRAFESPSYEIRNHSSIEVDTYVNRIAVDDDAGIVLLAEGEDPLDHTDTDNPSLEDISTPLLRLNIKTGAEEVQLYEAMAAKHLLRLSESSVVPLSLTGHFYGDYPRWVVDPEAEQGGYYEDSLVPRYRMVLRFVPSP